jgi:hypothetical protein
MWDLLKFAGAMREVAHTMADIDVLLKDQAVDNLGEKLLRTVKARHGDSSKLRPLMPSTQEQRSRSGYPPNQPLLREGDLRDSYECRLMSDPSGGGKALVLGSPMWEALWHEMGFYNVRAGVYVPARPVLMPTILEHKDDIEQVFGQAMVGLFGKALSSSTRRPFYFNRGITKL